MTNASEDEKTESLTNNPIEQPKKPSSTLDKEKETTLLTTQADEEDQIEDTES